MNGIKNDLVIKNGQVNQKLKAKFKYQPPFLNMNHYRGEVRRQPEQNANKSTFQNERNKFEQIQQEKYSRNNDFQKSQLSYYQSQVSHTIYDNEATQSQRNSDRTRVTTQNKEIYDKLIPVKVQSAESQEYSTYLRIQIINTIEKGMNKLTLYLTDDRNPKFLWLFFIKQNDFMVLKKEQKLRVDFRGFPTMLMDHFDMCKSQKQAANSINMNQCYFFCMFEIKKNEGSLSILQANKYKESVHLSLKCKLGNDEQIKEYLSEKLLKSQNENSNLNSKISYLEGLLSTRKEEITRIEIELKQQKKINEKSSEEFEIEMSKTQTELKRQKMQNEQRLKKSYEKEFKEMKQSLEEQLNKYMKSHQELKEKYEISQQKLAVLQSKERQSSFDVSTKGKEIQTYVKRLDEMKTYTVDLQNKRTQNQKMIIEQKVRIESLQSQITDKLKIIESNSQLKSTNSHQITTLQQKTDEYKKQVQKHQAKIQNLQNEIHKLQNTIEGYRQKYDKKKQKNQQKNNIIKQQQRYINQKENEIFQIKRLLQTKQKLIDQVKLDSQDKNRKINQLKRQIQQCQKKIKEDNDLITHLQKQLNQRTIGIRPQYNTTNSYQRSTSPFTSNVSVNRDYMATNLSLNNTSTSRLKFTSTADNNNEEVSEKVSRKEIEIKRYVPTNQQRERSKSPVLNSRLNQQKQPQENKSTGGMVKPVKFKFSQRE